MRGTFPHFVRSPMRDGRGGAGHVPHFTRNSNAEDTFYLRPKKGAGGAGSTRSPPCCLEQIVGHDGELAGTFPTFWPAPKSECGICPPMLVRGHGRICGMRPPVRMEPNNWFLAKWFVPYRVLFRGRVLFMGALYRVLICAGGGSCTTSCFKRSPGTLYWVLCKFRTIIILRDAGRAAGKHLTFPKKARILFPGWGTTLSRTSWGLTDPFFK